MRQARAAKTLGIKQKEFVETYGDIDFVPRQADMDPPIVANMVQDKRNEIETSNMNPLLKMIALKSYDRAFNEKTLKNIQRWEDMKYYWGSFADLFKRKGKQAKRQAMTEQRLRALIRASLSKK